MIRVAWRQFRTQALVTIALLVAFAAFVLVFGLHLRHAYNFCIPQHSCAAPSGSNAVLAGLLGPALLAIPALLGMFWGAPLLAREFESGTFRLAWTQSVTRRRWLSVKVALVGGAVLAVTGIASWLVSWGLAPVVAIDVNRFAPSMFTARGIVAIGYAAFAFGLGVAAGALIRRSLPAMVTTLVGFVATRLAFTFWIRPHLLPAREALFSVVRGKGVAFVSSGPGVSVAPSVPPIPNAWMVSETLIDRTHGVLSAAQLHELLVRTCPTITNGPAGSAKADAVGAACQQRLSHHLLQLVSYQPPSHYWPLQALETGIFLVAALALIAATIWWVGPHGGRATATGKPGEPSKRLTAVATVMAIAAFSLLIAGCGSKSTGSPSASSSSNQATPAQMQQDGIRFAGCMHSHGMPTFPSPSDPQAFKSALDPASPGAQSPTFRSAYSACRHLLPNGGRPPSAPNVHTPSQIAAFLAFARCIRSHGFPSFPDPTNSGQLTHQMVAGAGINLHQPAVLQAGDACVSVSHGFITKAMVARFVAGQ